MHTLMSQTLRAIDSSDAADVAAVTDQSGAQLKKLNTAKPSVARYLGRWLEENGHIGQGELAGVLKILQARQTRVGELAQELGYLDREQVMSILAQQRETGATFGATAQELGLLDEETLGSLLAEQKRRHRPIGAVLVECGFLDQETLDRLLEEFHAQQNEIVEQQENPPGEVRQHALLAALVEISPPVLEQLIGWPVKAGDWGLDATDDETAIGYVPFTGGLPSEVGLRCTMLMAQHIASRMVDMPVEEIDEELAIGCLDEAVNVIAGRAKQGLRPDDAEQVKLGLPVRESTMGKSWEVALETPEGRLTLLLGV